MNYKIKIHLNIQVQSIKNLKKLNIFQEITFETNK